MESNNNKPMRRGFCSESLLMILSLTLAGVSNKKMNKKLIERFGSPSFETSLPAYKSKLLKFASKAYRAKIELDTARAQVANGTMTQHAYDILARTKNVFAMDFKSVQWTESEKLQIIEYGQRWIELQHHRTVNSLPSSMLQEPSSMMVTRLSKTKEELTLQNKLLCDQLDMLKQPFARQNARPAWMMTTPSLLAPLPQPTWGLLQQQNVPQSAQLRPQYLLLPQQQPQMYTQHFTSHYHQQYQSGMMMFPPSQ